MVVSWFGLMLWAGLMDKFGPPINDNPSGFLDQKTAGGTGR